MNDFAPPTGAPPRTFPLALLLTLLAGLLGACGAPEAAAPGAPPAPPPSASFTDVTAESGIRFVHHNGASPERYLPETMGSGVVVFDADGDGWPDLFFIDSIPVAQLGQAPLEGPAGALYRNRGDGSFEDVTAVSGITGSFLGMGGAAADVDNDGDDDLLLTGVGGERLFLGRGDGTFDEVTALWGLAREGFGSSAAFLDFDGDGWLDLFVGRYVEWSPASDLPCRPDGEHRTYCTPEAYPGASSRLYRNLGGEGFADVTAAAGLERPDGKTLGVSVLDFDADGWPDLAVANDTARNFLFRNRGDGTFEEIGVESGIAFGQSGAPRGAMGIDAGDLDGDGRPDLVVGNFAQEMSAVFRQRAGGIFVDDAASLGVGLPTLMSLTFGTLALDADGDGWLDLVFANGHIEPDIERFQPLQRFAQPLTLFRSLEGRGFEQVAAAPGTALARPLVARGLAAGDLDGDGDQDLVVTQNGGPAVILRNDLSARPLLRLRLEGRSSNRSGLGARVEVEAGGRTLHRWSSGGQSYLSSSEKVVTIGLGTATSAQAVRITWPSGIVQELGPLETGQVHHVVEPESAAPQTASPMTR